MDAQVVVDALKARGWEATIKKQGELEDLVPVYPNGLWKCVDGRLSDKSGDAMRGPKVLGGVYGLVVAQGGTSAEAVKKAVADIAAAGFVPSVHGDDHNHEMGCGFFKLWSTSQFEHVAPPEFSAQEGRLAATEAGAVYEQLTGAHEEEVVMINLVDDTTLEPNGKRFIVDAWVMVKLGADPMVYLTGAAQTVEKLNGPKKAVIIAA